MMARSKKQAAYNFGIGAERVAGLYLALKGYRILSTRCRNAGGEIDLLAMRGRDLVAIEVKARGNLKDCEETVMPWKQEKIARALSGVLAGQPKISGLDPAKVRNIRFDVIWIARGRWPKHIKDAWRM